MLLAQPWFVALCTLCVCKFLLWYHSCPSWRDCGHGRMQPKNEKKLEGGWGGGRSASPPDAGSHALFTPMSLHEYVSYIDFEVGTNPTVRICAVVQTHHLFARHSMKVIISNTGASLPALKQKVVVPRPSPSSSPPFQPCILVLVMFVPPLTQKKTSFRSFEPIAASSPLSLPTMDLRHSNASPTLLPTTNKEVVVAQPLTPPPAPPCLFPPYQVFKT